MNKPAHDMFPEANHDELSQQAFLRSFMMHIYEKVMPGNDVLYQSKIKPQFEKEFGREPETRREVREALGKEPYNQMWSSLMRTSQEMMYSTVRPSIERQMPALKQKASALKDEANTKSNPVGSLSLDPELEIPSYHTHADIHCKPGGYHTKTHDGDFLAGAEFDRTVMVYFHGKTGPLADDMGLSLARWIKENNPEFDPAAILDMGCTIGHSSVPYTDVYPDAEVHAIDVAAPCLEYGHYRAEALGKPVHFSQQNAEKTNYADGSFDLIVSHILMHETSHKALENIIAECHRLLKPGGLMIHMDVVGAPDPFGQYLCEWNAHYNNEPYMGGLQDEDFPTLFSEAGFVKDSFFMEQIESVHLPKTMPEVMAAKRAEGVVIGIGYYTIIGSRKAAS